MTTTDVGSFLATWSFFVPFQVRDAISSSLNLNPSPESVWKKDPFNLVEQKAVKLASQCYISLIEQLLSKVIFSVPTSRGILFYELGYYWSPSRLKGSQRRLNRSQSFFTGCPWYLTSLKYFFTIALLCKSFPLKQKSDSNFRFFWHPLSWNFTILRMINKKLCSIQWCI